MTRWVNISLTFVSLAAKARPCRSPPPSRVSQTTLYSQSAQTSGSNSSDTLQKSAKTHAGSLKWSLDSTDRLVRGCRICLRPAECARHGASWVYTSSLSSPGTRAPTSSTRCSSSAWCDTWLLLKQPPTSACVPPCPHSARDVHMAAMTGGNISTDRVALLCRQHSQAARRIATLCACCVACAISSQRLTALTIVTLAAQSPRAVDGGLLKCFVIRERLRLGTIRFSMYLGCQSDNPATAKFLLAALQTSR